MKRVIVFMLALFMLACSADKALIDKGYYYIDSRFSSCSQLESGQERVNYIILHYTVDDDDKALDILTNGRVSSHYMLPSMPIIKENKPILLQMVMDNNIAFHAGVGNWNGLVSLNNNTLAIEIVNKGFTEDVFGNKTWYPYNDQQIDALILLLKDIVNKYHIKPQHILGHSDIAPLRKYDPGPLFPWQKLAQQGIGIWPDKLIVAQFLAGRDPLAAGNILMIQKGLKAYGYGNIPQSGLLDSTTRQVISAFQMHFRANDIRGNADAETESIILALLTQLKKSKY